MKKNLQMILFEYIDQKSFININLIGGNEEISAIPISVSDELLLILRFYDFMPDGYEIIGINEIDTLVYDETCQFFESIVKREGAMTILEKPIKIRVNNWQTALRDFQSAKCIIMLEIGKEDVVNIGKVTHVGEDVLSMRCFGPTGKWDEEEWDEQIDNISSITFSNHYINTFLKYIDLEQ